MKNKLIDVHNNLVATLEDLDNEELLNDPVKLENLCKIAKAKCVIASAIINVDTLGLTAQSEKYTLLNDTPDLMRLE